MAKKRVERKRIGKRKPTEKKKKKPTGKNRKMTRKPGTKPAKKKVARKARRPRKAKKIKPTGLLVIHCDPQNIQTASAGRRTLEIVNEWMPSVPIRSVDAVSSEQLLQDCARIFDEGFRAKVVLLVGHANTEILVMANSYRPTWAQVAGWLKPFEPEHVVVFGCEGASTLPGMALMEGLATLQAVHGSPLKHNDSEMQGIVAQVLILLSGVKLSLEVDAALRGINFALTRGVLVTRTRDELLGRSQLETTGMQFVEKLVGRVLGR